MSGATIAGDLYVELPRALPLPDGTVVPAGTRARLDMGGLGAHAATHKVGGTDALAPNDIGAVAKGGDTMTGNLVMGNHSVIDFGSSVISEKLRLYSNQYTIGVQGNSLYLRTPTNIRFYIGGTHAPGDGDAGGGGQAGWINSAGFGGPAQNLYNLNASNLAYGTIPYARLGMAQGGNWVMFPGGYIIQWGEGSFNGSTSTVVTLPLAFPNALLRAFGTDDTSSASVYVIGMVWGGSTRTQIKFTTTGTGAWGFSYLAIGA